MELIWNEQNQNAVVHEVRSDSPEITLPETVEGRNLVAVGAYCFSDRKRKETSQNGITTVNGEPCDHSAQGSLWKRLRCRMPLSGLKMQLSLIVKIVCS